MSCDDIRGAIDRAAKADSGFDSWECLQFGLCPEVASAAVPVAPGAPALPPLSVPAQNAGAGAASAACAQACTDAIDYYKAICWEPVCSTGDDCTVTRARFYENAECAMARFDYSSFCQISHNFTPNDGHQWPINRSLDKAQGCANIYATECGGQLSIPYKSRHYNDLAIQCG